MGDSQAARQHGVTQRCVQRRKAQRERRCQEKGAATRQRPQTAQLFAHLAELWNYSPVEPAQAVRLQDPPRGIQNAARSRRGVRALHDTHKDTTQGWRAIRSARAATKLILAASRRRPASKQQSSPALARHLSCSQLRSPRPQRGGVISRNAEPCMPSALL